MMGDAAESVTQQRVCVLGSTGSIGKSTLDVLARHPQRFGVLALGAATQVDVMLQQCAQFRPRFAVMADAACGRALAEKVRAQGLDVQVLCGARALDEVAAHPDVDVVMAAIVGAAGLAPCLAAARAGKRLLLANKEALVMGGDIFLAAVRRGGARLLPVDSEHSAIFQALPEDPKTWPQRVDKIILTASGGPFRTRDAATLRDVTPEQACAHPNWSMGRKISVDSATMMNKALEVIEARWLFNMPPRRIGVVIHPQSVVHSMVQYRDASIVAQMGVPDMRVPIACALSWPQRIENGVRPLDFSALGALTFELPDLQRFPALALSWQALEAAPGTPVVLNAANEVAVEAFLQRRIRFDRIGALVRATMEQIQPESPQTLEDLLALDARARAAAGQRIANWQE